MFEKGTVILDQNVLVINDGEGNFYGIEEVYRETANTLRIGYYPVGGERTSYTTFHQSHSLYQAVLDQYPGTIQAARGVLE